MNRLLLVVVSLVALAALLVTLPACGTKPPAYKQVETDKVEDQNPWSKLIPALRKDSDSPSCRQTLTQLNNDLAAQSAANLQPESLSPETEKALREALGLNEQEAKELRSPSYGGLDPHYLAECLYLADVARSLEATGLPPARQAELAFRWVCRQITLRPWVMHYEDAGLSLTAVVPPMYVLRRGSGSGLERAYVCLALFQQLGLDGCLVAGPDAAKLVGSPQFPLGQQSIPQGAFWAVGVRVGAEVILFDPWRGEAVPGPNGVATVAQVRANPDLLKPWRDDKDNPWAVPPEAVKGATICLTAPLSGMAPRFRRLEQELKADPATTAKLVVDPLALKTRFVAETKLAETMLWNPSNDILTPTRVHGTFFPPDKGGFARSDRVFNEYPRNLIPPQVFSVPPDLLPKDDLDAGVPEAAERLKLASLNVFTATFLNPPIPRELIHRGLYAHVTSQLVEKRKLYVNAQQRVKTDRNRVADTAEWCKKARSLYERVSKVRTNNPVEQAEAQAAVEEFWKREAATAQAIVEAAVAEAGAAEATYLLALSMHEQAERAQAKAERLATDPKQKSAADKARQDAAAAWGEAKGWWTLYEQGPVTLQEKTYPGRTAHAKRAAQRAAEMATR